jgi:hypothetical protein
MKRALFLTTWTPNNEIFWRSLECVGWEVIPHRYDDRPHGRHWELVDFANQVKPDAIAYVGALESHGISNPIPEPEVLKKLRDTAPMIMLCGDACIPEWQPELAVYQTVGSFDVYVSMDGSPSEQPNVIAKLTPIDARPYKPLPWAERDIFLGSNSGPGKGGEAGAVTDLLGTTIPGYTQSSDDMAAFLCRCKVVPNAPESGHQGYDHVKGRVVEAGMAGACLLERTTPATARWFTPGVEYVEYAQMSEARNRLEWIRNNDAEAQQIAQRFHGRVVREHHPEVFWRDVMGRVGITW